MRLLILLLALAATLSASVAAAAAAPSFDAGALEGTWRGTWRPKGAGADVPVVLAVARAADGGLRVALDVPGEGLGCGEESSSPVDLLPLAALTRTGVSLRTTLPFAGPARVQVTAAGRVKAQGGPAPCDDGPTWTAAGAVRGATMTLATTCRRPGARTLRGTVTLTREPPRGAPLRALLIPANFPDAVSALTRDEIRAYFDGAAFRRPGAARSVRAWTHEVSAGRVDLTAEVPEFVTLPNPAAHYRAAPAERILLDAVAALDARGFDFAPFDGDADGVVDLVGVLYRGPAPRYGTGNGPAFTQAPFLDPGVVVDGVRVDRGFVFPDWFPAVGTKIDLAAMTHEGLWHALGRVPDLNAYDGSRWLGNGIDDPTHFTAYGKLKLGWVTVRDAEGAAQDVALASSARSADVVRLWIDPWREHEYFLLETRRRAGADRACPGEGLLVWHVDEMADQTGFLALEQADGLDELSVPTGGRGFGRADAGDPFPGARRRRSFTDATSPSARARDGRATGIRVEEISDDGWFVRARVTPSPDLVGFTLAHDETYPRFSTPWGPVGTNGGNAPGEHVAVRFTAPVAADLRRIRLSIVHPGTRRARFEVHGDFDAAQTLAGPPRAAFEADVAGDFAWTTVELPSPLRLAAGEAFVVDVVLDDPVVAIDRWGRPSGASRYRAPGAASYVAVPYDVRLRAQLAPAAD